MINFKRVWTDFNEEPLKTRKKPHMDDTILDTEPTPHINPGDLKNYIKNPKVIQLLNQNGIKALFPIQYSTFHLIYKGSDIRAKDRTGSGKTLAFALPIIQRLRCSKQLHASIPSFLVILPTRELVLQVANNFEKLRLTEDEFMVAAVYGGEQKYKQIDKINRGVDVIVATPGRLIDLANRGVIDFSGLKVVCLDEADQMLKQGFKEDVENIFQLIAKKTTKPQTLLFSATFPKWVNQLSANYQTKDCPMIDLIKDNSLSIPSTITNYLLINDRQQLPQLIRRIRSNFTSRTGRTIIFCETKREVNQIHKNFKNEGCAMLSGDVPQNVREYVYRDFKSGKILTVVATNVAARGLDFPDIELVIQIEPPKQVESYIHRAGRTGRAGKKGICVLISRKRNQNAASTIEREAKIRFQSLRLSDLPPK